MLPAMPRKQGIGMKFKGKMQGTHKKRTRAIPKVGNVAQPAAAPCAQPMGALRA